MRKNTILYLIFIFASCSQPTTINLDKNSPFNGKITYEISYPYNQKDDFLNLYPTELVVEIEDSLVHSIINDIGIKLDTYVNTKSKEIDQYIEIAIPHSKYHVHLNEEDIVKINKKLPQYQFESTNIFDTLDNCQRQKILAIPKDPKQQIAVWVTEDISISGLNFFGPFSKIDKTLLDFEATNLGFRTRLKAKKITPCKVKIKIPTNKEGFKTIPLDSLEREIASIFGIK